MNPTPFRGFRFHQQNPIPTALRGYQKLETIANELQLRYCLHFPTIAGTIPFLSSVLSPRNIKCGEAMADKDVTPRIVEQRIRNRVIEYLEMVSAYENDPPPFDLNEVLNQWNDWVSDEYIAAEEEFPTPSYSQRERDALIVVNNALIVLCEATPQIIKHEHTVLDKQEWHNFVTVSRDALAIMLIRGSQSETEEEC